MVRALMLAFKMLLTLIEPSKRVSSRAYLEDATNSESPSPTSSPNLHLSLEATHRSQNQSHPSPGLKPIIRTPLLMPPPSTALSRVKHRMALYRHYLRSWATLNRQSLQLAIRLAIFAAKVLSITKPCGPVATREAVWWPLIGLAALELALGNRLGWRHAGFFAVVHVLVLVLVVIFGGGLCVINRKGLDEEWRWRDET
jgi:hypothetical protein